MDFVTAVKTCLTQKYATFSGRASRSEFWWFVLAYVIGMLVVSLAPVLPLLYVLALFVPMLAVGFRRLQDTGRPGWYFLIPSLYNLAMRFLGFGNPEIDPTSGMPTELPSTGGMVLSAIFGLIGLAIAVVYIYWLTRPSEPETNAYGPPPAA
ncbi:DUF805 domain-containing protein [Roseovarius amoyensis]|uniref:DUF805 domain-containing protein n=1 Tax=Roseovarius amoyensis TaxID=2211448 RepID=UPI000DBEA057|nr:DUF805 domain-containing protein [Roseovarius amoyensis]